MQDAMHQKMRKMRGKSLALGPGLGAGTRQADHHIGVKTGRVDIVKGEHIGGRIAFAIGVIERLALLIAHKPHGDACTGTVVGQRGADQTADA